MKKKKLNIFSSLILLAFCLNANSTFAKEQKKIEWGINYKFQSQYDDNILGYSDKYYQKFLNKEDPGRFHISTFDDMIINNSIDANFAYKFFKKYNTELNIGISYKAYTKNSIKNWLLADISLTQEISNHTSLSIGYSILPKFYIRHYRDFDYALLYGYTPESLKEFSFSKENINFKVKHNYNKDLTLNAGISYSSYIYPKEFTEYDSKDYGLELGADYKVSPKLKFFGTYKFLFSDARGYDKPEAEPYIFTHSDATYYEHSLNIGSRYYLPHLFEHKNYALISLTYNRAIFTTDHAPELDDLHSGRVDNEIKAGINYNFIYNEDLTFGLSYSFFIKECDAFSALNRQSIMDEKNYNKNVLSFDIIYKFNN